MNNKLLNKLNNLSEIAKNNNNTIKYNDMKEEIFKNKDLRSDYQLDNAVNWLKEHGITIIDDASTDNITISSEDDLFNKKLNNIIAIGKKNGNIIADTKIIDEFNKCRELLTVDNMTKIFDVLEENHIEVVTVKDNNEEEIIDDIDDSFDTEELEDIVKQYKADEIEERENEIENYNRNLVSKDALTAYMHDLNLYATPLLTAEEEIELSKQAQNGDNEAFEHMMTSNLKLVISIAKKFGGHGVLLGDLIQEGNIGLAKAVTMYNPDLGFRFSTYATHWIRQAITRALATSARIIRMPVHAVEQARLNQIAYRTLVEELDRIPTSKEVSDYVNENNMLTSSNKKMTPENVDLYARYYSPDAIDSLDRTIGKSNHYNPGLNDETFLMDFIEDESQNTETKVMQTVIKETIHNILENVLTEKEADIMRKRFGIDCDYAMTLEEIGQIYGVTRERIRQIEVKAMRKIKRSGYAKKQLQELNVE